MAKWGSPEELDSWTAGAPQHALGGIVLSWKWLSRSFALYSGFKLVYESYNMSGEVLLSTDNPQIAAELGFQIKKDGSYLGWVPHAEVDEFSTERWWGEVAGETVFLTGEEGDEYSVQTTRTIGVRWNLVEAERGTWVGRIPRTAFARVWCEKTTWSL